MVTKDQVEREAEDACRQVGIATQMAAILPGLAAIAGPVTWVILGEPIRALSVVLLVAFAAGSIGLFALGVALRRRRPWSFVVTMVVFGLVAAAGVGGLIFGSGRVSRGPVLFVVGIPLAFVFGADRARRASDAAARFRDGTDAD